MTKGKDQSSSANDGFSLISNQKLLSLYSTMTLCRKMAENAANGPGKKRRAGGAHSILGHEAAAVGTVIDLLAHDMVAPALWPGGALMAINPSVSMAPRLSLANTAARADRVAVFFSAGRHGSQAAWLKAMSRAAERNLPVLFVSLDRPANENAVPMKKNGYAFPSIAVDGNDVVAVYRVASEAINHARKGHGPTLIECKLSVTETGDPIENMEAYLIRKGLRPEKRTA